jgi:hypothetical protein
MRLRECESQKLDPKAIRYACYAAQKTVMYVVYSSIDLVRVTTVNFLVLFLILFPRFLDIRLVAVSQRILIIVAGILDVLAVGARNRAAIAKKVSVIAPCHRQLVTLTHHWQAAQRAVDRKDWPEGNPVEHTGRLGDIVAVRMGLEVGSLAGRKDQPQELDHNAHKGLRRAQERRQELRQQPSSRRRNRLDEMVSTGKRSVPGALCLYIPSAFISNAPPARPAAAPPAPYSLNEMLAIRHQQHHA